jgi:hypothetical protein
MMMLHWLQQSGNKPITLMQKPHYANTSLGMPCGTTELTRSETN